MRFWSRSWTMPRARTEPLPSGKPPHEADRESDAPIQAFGKGLEQPGRDMLCPILTAPDPNQAFGDAGYRSHYKNWIR
jgi:hypothetical protein